MKLKKKRQKKIPIPINFSNCMNNIKEKNIMQGCMYLNFYKKTKNKFNLLKISLMNHTNLFKN
jgi:predicted metal-binding protein